MRKFVKSIIAIAIVSMFASCAIHSGLPKNTNTNTTKVTLQDNNFTVVQKVSGSSTGLTVLGFGGSFKPLVAQARANMLASAELTGSSRAVINEIVEVNDKFFVFFIKKTVTVSAYVIEFTK